MIQVQVLLPVYQQVLKHKNQGRTFFIVFFMKLKYFLEHYKRLDKIFYTYIITGDDFVKCSENLRILSLKS